MADIAAPQTMLTTADGRPLKESLQKALRQQRNQAFMLTLPLLVFIMIFFIVPIVLMLIRSVDNTVVSTIMPRTVAIIGEWDSKSEPPEALFKAAFEDIREEGFGRLRPCSPRRMADP